MKLRPSWEYPTELVMTAVSAHLLLRSVVILSFLRRLSAAPVGADGWVLLGLEPVGLAAASVTLLALWRKRRQREGRPFLPALGGFVIVTAIYYFGPFGMVARDLGIWNIAPALVIAGAAGAGAWALRRGRRSSTAALFGVTLVGAAIFHAGRTPEMRSRLNSLGLLASVPGVVDFKRAKGEYPACTARHNSLGYRDDEPPDVAIDHRRRILIVGDSFVWGDGIPSNEETIGRLLGAALEEAAPGRYTVISAANRGLGLFGYARIISALEPRYRPETIVVGYLGNADLDPLDPQFLADRLPAGRWAKNLFVGMRAVQYVHEAAVVLHRIVWSSAESKAYFDALGQELTRRAAQRGYRLLFLAYFKSSEELPAKAEVLSLPEELRYQRHANEFWYAGDCHPKPALNRILAKKLAAAIHRPGGT